MRKMEKMNFFDFRNSLMTFNQDFQLFLGKNQGLKPKKFKNLDKLTILLSL